MLFGIFPSKGVWRRPGLRPVDLLVFAALLALLFGLLRLAPREQTVALYRDVFLAAMASPASRGRNANALQHAYSLIGRELDRPRRHDLVARIEAYRRGEEPLSVPVALLAHYASGGGFGWLAEQTYLQPFPDVLRLRQSV